MDAPYSLILKIVRAAQAEEPYAFSPFPQDYLFIFGLEERVGSARFPWNEALLSDVAASLRSRPDRNRVQRLGETLRTFLENGLRKHKGWAVHEEAILRAVEAGRPIHLTFRFDAAELYSLPWELMALGSSGQLLGELPGCLIQYEWPGARGAPPRPVPSSAPGRLLFGWSFAGGLVPSSEHQRALTEAAARGAYRFDATQDVVSDLSLAALEKALHEASQAGRPVTFLHLLCHGTRTPDGTTGLRWDASDLGGEPEFIDAASLRQILAPYHATLRWVVLCACHGGDPGLPGNVLGSVAQELHRVGIAAVVASRMPLSREGSIEFTRALYGALEGPESIRPALLAASRRLVRTGGFDWASLQLYARAGDESPPDQPRPGGWRPAALVVATAALLILLGAGLHEGLKPDEAVSLPRVETPPDSGTVLEEQTLAGRVVDEDDQPVTDARMTMFVGGQTVTTRTDEFGYFHMLVRAERQLSVSFVVEKDGFERYEDNATLGNTNLGFALKQRRP